MTFNLHVLLLLGGGYLAILFLLALVIEKGWISSRLAEHPLISVLAMGVFACSWAYYGVIDLANEYGYGALAYYMGIGGLFIFSPLLLSPLFRLTRLYQLGSLADLLVFRFRGRRVGAIVTVGLLLAVLPLLALQIQAVADTMQLLSVAPVIGDPETARSNHSMALMFCLGLALFTALFGAGRDRHRGLVVTLALDSLIKLSALLAVGCFAVWGVFGSLPQLQWWLVLHPENLETLHTPVRNTSSHTLLLLFFASAVAMPHIFHVTLREHDKQSTLRLASWAIPLYLLIISLPIFPILWAGFELGSNQAPEYFTLGVPLASGKKWLILLSYLGGLSAAAGAMVVISLSVATMCLNHLILPLLKPDTTQDFYRLLLWLRRVMILGIILLAYFFYAILRDGQGLSNLAILSFVLAMQFLPGILAVLYWPLANRNGLLAGLGIGTTFWFVGLLCPMLSGQFRTLEIPSLGLVLHLGMEYWSIIGVTAFCMNAIGFIVVSLLTERSAQEISSAEISSIDSLNRPMRREMDITSAQEIKQRLATSLGERLANSEVERALRDLQLPDDERRPYALRRLRDRLEANLSGLMGSALAHEMIDRLLPYQSAEAPVTEDIYFAENQLNQYRHHLTGLAAELDNLRRYHRQILEDLPMAICSVGNDREILMWNHAMENLTGIAAPQVLGSTLSNIAEPWRTLLDQFFEGDKTHVHKQRFQLRGKPHWINLHKALIANSVSARQDGQVLMLEDLTETQRLEEELIHSERLASVGRLAAGVAHEIGNPVTGIACLAQNLESDSAEPESQEAARQILSQTQRISNIVSTLVNFSHSGTPDQEPLQPVDITRCVTEAIHLLQLDKSGAAITFINEIPEGTLVMGNEQRLTQVMINLLGNARDASREHGRIWVRTQTRDHSRIITVTDEGSGIPAEYLSHIFEPFFTTKQAGVGTGLGLALVYNIIEEHYGSIQVSSPAFPAGSAAKGPGTCFTITLASVSS